MPIDRFISSQILARWLAGARVTSGAEVEQTNKFLQFFVIRLGKINDL
jgi:hypothetical protein